MAERKPYPGFWQAVLLCALLTVLGIGLSIPVGVVDFVFKTRWSLHPAFAAAVNAVSCALTMAVAFSVGRPPAREVFAFRPVGAALLAAAAVATCGSVILVSELDNLLRMVWPQPAWLAELFGRYFGAGRHPVWAFLLMVVIAPVTEELFFRGLILRGMLGRCPPPTAILATAVLFALAHLNPWQALSALSLGTLVGFFYFRTRSLLPPLLGHALANAAVYSAPVLPIRIEGFNTPAVDAPVSFQPWWFDVIGLGLLALGLQLFTELTRKPPATEVAPLADPRWDEDERRTVEASRERRPMDPQA